MCRYSFCNTVQQLKNEKFCGARKKLAHTWCNGMVQFLPKTCSLVKSSYLSISVFPSKGHISLLYLYSKNATYDASQATHPLLITKADTLFTLFGLPGLSERKTEASFVFSLIYPSRSCLIFLLLKLFKKIVFSPIKPLWWVFEKD